MRFLPFRLSIFSLFCLGHFSKCQETADPVKVTTFYESLCPDSIRFFTTQLEPTYNELKSIMDVNITAYGKAEDVARPSGEGYIFTCQHGSRECYGNKVLECGQKYITNHDQYLQFAFCVMGSNDPPSSGEECSSHVGFASFENIEQCANSTEGEVVLHEAGLRQEVGAPGLYYVPWIIINDEFSEENLAEAQSDLKGLVCATYSGTLPDECVLHRK